RELHTLRRQKLQMGIRDRNTFHIFLLENEPRWEKSQSSPGGYLTTKMSTLVTGFFLILLAGTIYYGRYTQPKMSSHINAASRMTMNST
ncbi:hypothetical protein B1153_07575, partial [Enterococcus faecium]